MLSNVQRTGAFFMAAHRPTRAERKMPGEDQLTD
jgi:hypothetical protein